MAELISDEEFLELKNKRKQAPSKLSSDGSTGNVGAELVSDEEFIFMQSKSRTPSANNAFSTIGDYLRAVPATAVDITAGAAEGLASAIGEFTGDYDLARSISETRTDINDAIMGDAPDSVKSDFAYKVASGLGSTIPYLGAGYA